VEAVSGRAYPQTDAHSIGNKNMKKTTKQEPGKTLQIDGELYSIIKRDWKEDSSPTLTTLNGEQLPAYEQRRWLIRFDIESADERRWGLHVMPAFRNEALHLNPVEITRTEDRRLDGGFSGKEPITHNALVRFAEQSFVESCLMELVQLESGGAPTTDPGGIDENVFSRTGEFWTVCYQGKTLPPIRHRAGMTYISELLAQRGKPIPAAKLYEAENPPPPEKARNDRENDRSLSDEYGTGGGRRGGLTKDQIRTFQDAIADRENELENPTIKKADESRLEREIKQIRDAIRQGQNPIEDKNTRNPRTAVKNAVGRAMQAIIDAGGQKLADHLKTIQTGNNPEYTGGLFWEI